MIPAIGIVENAMNVERKLILFSENRNSNFVTVSGKCNEEAKEDLGYQQE